MRTVQSKAEEICIYVDNSCDAKTVACESFVSGVEFAQRWISIDEELPPVSQQVIVKLKNNWHACTWLLGDGTFAYNIKPTHWRYIDLK